MPRTQLLLLSCLAMPACQAEAQAPKPSPVTERPSAQDPAPATEPAARTPTAKTKEAKPPVDAAPTFAAELARMDAEIAANTKRAEAQPNSYIVLGQLAGKQLARARLSGDWADYGHAEATLDKAFAVREGTGPWMTRARLNYTLHRLPRVREDLDTYATLQKHAMKAGEVVALIVFEGELAFQLGDYAKALAQYDTAAKMDPDNQGMIISRGVYLWKTGDFEGAEKLFAQADAQYHGKAAEPRAWLDLVRGLMDLDRGRYDDALAHYHLAEKDLAGYWLIDEHIAEILTLTDKTEEAKAMYLDIIERTGNPEFLDAMAGILREEGKEAEAEAYIAKADAKFAEQLQTYPEAAYGHALGHYLEFGKDPKFTLDLALKNHTIRPNGEAKTLLAQAYLAAGEPKQAKKIIEQALKSPFSTADLHATAAEVYAALGDEKKAQAQRDAAVAINPHALDE